jgi:hypothetical protein
MAHSTMAKKIQKQFGTKPAANYMMKKGFPLYLTMFVLTGKWVLP